MIYKKDIARNVAEHLLQIKAIKLQPTEPFTWASGWKSPIYCDNRLILSYPTVRNFVREQLVAAIESEFGTPNVIAGVATGAIAMGALVAQQMGLPFVYIRPEAKSHGRKNQIEGHLEPGQSVVVVEDLISTGGSSLKAVEAVREARGHVLGMAGIFTYGFPVADKNMEKANCNLVTLSDYSNLLEEVSEKGFMDKGVMETLQEWRIEPSNWNGVS